MANPIQKNDLITDEALSALTTMSTTLSTIAENLIKAKAACQGWGEEEKKTAAATGDNVEELSKMAARITQLEDAVKKLNAAEKENENARRSVNEQKRLYRKLTDDEIKSVEDLKRALQGSVDEQMKAVNAIEVEKKSYNELNQVYNALKDSLNKMTTAERNSTEAGKAMTAQASKVYETMNQLQQATGKYTLQVGKYRAAFDGLGYSFQQILREAPSALNFNQFFLAISNNIPLFIDQLKAFKDEQAEIKDNLKQMTKGTKEYAEQQEKVVSLGQKLGKVIFSWQSLVLIGLLALRNLPKIVDWFKELFGNVKNIVSETMKLRWAMADLWNNVEKNVSNTAAELRILVNRLGEVKRGTEEYATIVGRINEITNSTLNTTTAQIDEVKRLTKAYMEQQIQLATNAEVVGRIGSNRANIRKRDTALTVGLPTADRARSITSDTEQQEELTKMLEEHEKAVKAYNDAVDKGIKDRVVRYRKRELNALGEWVDREHVKLEYRPATGKELTRLDQERMHWKVSAESYINNILGIVSQDIMDAWAAEYKAVLTEDKKNGPKGKQPSEQSTSDRYWEAERALLNAMEEGVQKEIEISDWERRKNKDEQDKWYAEQLAALEENVKNGFTTREQADKEALELTRQYNALQEDEDRQHNERVVKIQMDAYRKQLAIREELHKKEMQAIVETSKSDTVHVQRRVRNATQEANKNAALATNIEHLVEAKKKLMAVDIAMDENKTLEERIKLLEQLNKQIERYASQISITQKIRQYGSVSDMLGTFIGGRVGGQGKENLISNILGEDAMKARIAGFQADNPDGWEKDYMDWLDGEFEEWGKQAMSAATTWYSTTMGYINDLISAYVELANAKAEAAAEATEAAQEEYDKEKALLEAGYASRVEATWAEYQEKKAAQEKAEADAKEAAKAQQQLNEAEAMGSLIVASANIWKTFSKIPTVGVPLALAALATMWGSFIQAKVKAAEVSKYGEGGFEVLEGGSHASGHDIDLGVKNRRGRRMRAEGKEGLGIFSRRAMEHYGANNIEAMVNSVNRLEFEGNAAKRMSLERSVGMAVLSAPRTDLHRVENSLDKLVSYGSRSRYTEKDGTVVEVRNSGVVRYRK